MTNVESARKQIAVTGPSRRMILRNSLLVGAGVVAAGATSVAQAGSAKADASPTQADWGWCSKCQGLYYVNSTKSVCPYDSVFARHGKDKSFQYFVYYNTSGNMYYQDGWAWCGACAGLFYADGAKTAGSCPDLDGRGPHLNSGWNYTLGHVPADPSLDFQDGWLHCRQCQGIFFSPTSYNAGVCPLDNSAYLHYGAGSYGYIMLTSLREDDTSRPLIVISWALHLPSCEHMECVT